MILKKIVHNKLACLLPQVKTLESGRLLNFVMIRETTRQDNWRQWNTKSEGLFLQRHMNYLCMLTVELVQESTIRSMGL